MREKVLVVDVGLVLKGLDVDRKGLEVVLVVVDEPVFAVDLLMESDGTAVPAPDVPERIDGHIQHWNVPDSATDTQR